MDWLEQELGRALKREDPPSGFAERVLRKTRRPKPAAHALLRAAAVLMVISGSAWLYREHQGRAAKEQVMQAMRIAALSMNQIQTHVQEAVR
jgi:hypothetical protein